MCQANVGYDQFEHLYVLTRLLGLCGHGAVRLVVGHFLAFTVVY